ncbi:hypothetical protein EDD16DRAFT_1695989 [Pisolithus croceorrhizus]|nr:hypothetical protein EDD16DRAFT_1695989 [Pisolithus croceorrhizus]
MNHRLMLAKLLFAAHVYVTGSSQGKERTFLSFIVAHPQNKLDAALRGLEVFCAFSSSLSTAVPDAVFACAGASRPKYLIDMTAENFERDMTDGFWVQAWTAFAAAKEMARQNKKGEIISVSSTLGYMFFVGYSSYAPTKHALRGTSCGISPLELLLYGIDIDIFPPTMYTPGFDEENKTKPSITRKIESTDKGVIAEQAATGLLAGVQRGDHHITADLITSLFRASIKDSALRSNLEIGVLVWNGSVDKQVIAHRQNHKAYFKSKILFSDQNNRAIGLLCATFLYTMHEEAAR